MDDSASFSAGQQPLVTTARTMIDAAPLLILYEAPGSVDTRTRELIQKAMDELTVGRRSFVIAHRLSTIRDADLILVMQAGDLIGNGRHNELLPRGEFYADLLTKHLAWLLTFTTFSGIIK